METWTMQILTGISYGSLLLLLALGLSLIMGVMNILNLAHGSIYMVGAYVGLTIARLSGPWGNFWLAALVAGLTGGLIGLALERGLLRRLYKQLDNQVLVTLAVVYMFENIAIWVWGPLMKIGTEPDFLSGVINIGELTFPIYRFVIIALALIITAVFWVIVEKTRAGAIIRAGMDNKETTEALGINYSLVGSAVFFLGTFVAGFAGFIASSLTGMIPGVGMPIMLFAVIVVILGGMGSIIGVAIGAMIIGIIDSLGRAFFPDFVLFTIYLVMIVVLLVKPSGIFGRAQT